MTRLTIRAALIGALLVAASPPVAAATPTTASVSPPSINTVRQETPSVSVVRFEIADLGQNEVTMLSKPGVSKRTQLSVQKGVLDHAIRQVVLRSTLRRDSLDYAILETMHDSLGLNWARSTVRMCRPSPARYRLVLTALNDIARNRGSTA